MILKKEKGVTIIEFLMASSLLLLLLFSFNQTLNVRISNNEYINKSLSTSEQIIKFSEATYKMTSGIGGITVQSIDVETLKDSGLLPMSFPDKTPFGQEIKGFFVTSPENENVIDVLITTTGKMDENLIGKSGRQNSSPESIQERTFLVLRRETLELETHFNDLYHIGKIKDNVFKSTGNLYEQSISMFNANIDSEITQPSILFKAPNQKGFWVFTLGTWMGSVTCNGTNFPIFSNGRPRCIAYGALENNAENRGFSYDCPPSATLINKNLINEEKSVFYDRKSRGGDKSGGMTYCFPAYKGDVQAGVNFVNSRYVFNGHPDGVSTTNDYPIRMSRGNNHGNVYTDTTPFTVAVAYRHLDNHNINVSTINGLNNLRYIHPNIRGKMNPLSNLIFMKTMTFKADGAYYQLFNVLSVLNTGSPTYANEQGAERSTSTKIGVIINPSNKNRATIDMKNWVNSDSFSGNYKVSFDTNPVN